MDPIKGSLTSEQRPTQATTSFNLGNTEMVWLQSTIFFYVPGTSKIVKCSCISARTPEQWSLETGERQPITGTLQIAYGIVVNKIQVFIQSILICAASQGAAVIYVFMNLVNVSPGVIIFGHVLWQFVHGAPVFIYIALNDMIRKRFFAMIKVQKKSNSTVVALSIINHSALVQH
ncbi:Protein CBR-SRT-35 [Caenorhabditis briggsae]|uniref:Protein CBR-SRT-35 n=1 Tax=Caenorhabditis briggsae TaxID=6238 RepID=A8WQD0_CAEBR|nr:Protein CBR-SRT-35 [Caenorhabditis briggsae]CAP22688.2 Protein CBR-SRT-35 [Caenorhabditis briggsae]